MPGWIILENCSLTSGVWKKYLKMQFIAISTFNLLKLKIIQNNFELRVEENLVNVKYNTIEYLRIFALEASNIKFPPGNY